MNEPLAELLAAIYRTYAAGVRAILSAGFDANTVDRDGRNALMHAILAESPSLEVIGHLLDAGTDLATQDSGQGWTALHFAARDQKLGVVRRLLEHGASVDPVDSFGNTPLWRCGMSAPMDLAVIRQLLQHGADPHRRNKHGSSPLDIARKLGDSALLGVLGEAPTNV